eukprot:GHVO01016752.1.p1 GENE.GHVO01016752.1~~GHVO01016752.1.p1  ORF type:complete len:565 (-),score=116.39 GHVO01016752.1:1177-2802(-)
MPRHVDREELETRGAELDPGPTRDCFKFKNMLFEEHTGYLLKKIPLRQLVSKESEVQATVTEVKHFKGSRNLEDLPEFNRLPEKGHFLRDSYALGDSVRVIAGEMSSLHGKVEKIGNDTISVRIGHIDKTVELAKTDIIKAFEAGESVRAVGGAHVGYTGLVTSVNEKERTAVIFSPSVQKTLTCLLNDLQSCPNHSISPGGLASYGSYSMGDLVQTTSGEVGVIVHIDTNRVFRLLKADNSSVPVDLTEISLRRGSGTSETVDASNEAFGVKSTVRVLDGEYKDKTGKVGHIWKNIVFVKIPNKIEDGGFVCADASNLKVVGQDPVFASPYSVADQTDTSAVPGGKRGGPFTQAGRPGAFKGIPFSYTVGKGRDAVVHIRPKRDPMMNKCVLILHGRHKGQLGKVYRIGDFGKLGVRPISGGAGIDLERNHLQVTDEYGGIAGIVRNPESRSFSQMKKGVFTSSTYTNNTGGGRQDHFNYPQQTAPSPSRPPSVPSPTHPIQASLYTCKAPPPQKQPTASASVIRCGFCRRESSWDARAS